MNSNEYLNQAYADYFGIEKNIKKNSIKLDKPPKAVGTIGKESLTANGNIPTVDSFCDELRKLLNVIWGSNWGELQPESAEGLGDGNIPMPSIRYSTNLREVTEGRNPKPTLTDIPAEVVNGVPTGHSYKVYRQQFDCIVEFNIRAENARDCSKLMEKFEDALILHAGYLKRAGLSEIFFLKEVPAKYSNFHIEGIPTKCIYVFVRLERVKSVDVSTLNKIEAKLRDVRENSNHDCMNLSMQK